MNMRRLVLISIITVLLALAFFFGWHFKQSAPIRSEPSQESQTKSPSHIYEMTADAQRNIGLTTDMARQDQVERAIHVTGAVSADESRVAHIFPLAQGVAQRIYVQLGDKVAAGQPLLQFDNVGLGNVTGERRSLLGSLAKAEAQQQVSRRSLDRAENLLKVEAISQSEYEVRKAEKEQADAGVASAKADLATSEVKLRRFGLSEAQVKALSESNNQGISSLNILRAPITGVITKYSIATGELMGPDKEVFTIVDPSLVWVLADVYEKELGLIPNQGLCRISVASFPGKVFVGKITYLSEYLDPQSRTAKLRCVVPNTEGKLRIDMFAEMEIPTTEKRTAITISNSAIQEIDNKPVVFVQRGSTQFEMRDVTLGTQGDNRTEVSKGVQPGERVVTQGTLQLKFEVQRGTLEEN